MKYAVKVMYFLYFCCQEILAVVVILILVSWIAFSFWYQKRNAYIEKHKRKMKNDTDYEKYLNWCEKHVQIPMNKEVFIKEIEEKEKEIMNILK